MDATGDAAPRKVPKARRDPKFLDNWKPVGDFPEVNLSLTAIITRFITAFGAGMQGIL